jgi:dihydrodipicolinate synthase/N-acetylneuraminate lyase
MALNTQTLEKIKSLRGDAARLAGFHETFATKFGADQRCDKKGFGFGKDSRFAAFNLQTSFDTWVGYYGNSGCSTALSVSDQKATSEFIIKAIGLHQKEIFATAAKLMREEAAELSAKASEELAALQSMLETAKAEAAPG